MLQSSLRASEADKRRMMDRIVKLEDELRVLRVTNGFVHLSHINHSVSNLKHLSWSNGNVYSEKKVAHLVLQQRFFSNKIVIGVGQSSFLFFFTKSELVHAGFNIVIKIIFSNSLESNENKISNGNVEDADAERMRLRKELSDMRKAKQNAEEHSLK